MGTEVGGSYRDGGPVLRCGMKCGTYSMAVPRGSLNLRGGGVHWAPVRDVFLRDHAGISVAVTVTVTGEARGCGRDQMFKTTIRTQNCK